MAVNAIITLDTNPISVIEQKNIDAQELRNAMFYSDLIYIDTGSKTTIIKKEKIIMIEFLKEE